MDEYRRLVLSDSASSGREGNGGGARRRDGPSRRDERRAAAERRTEAAALRRAVKDSEAALEKLTVQRTRLEMTLADPQLYEKEPNRLPQLLREQGELIKRIETAEAKWLAAQEALEKERAE